MTHTELSSDSISIPLLARLQSAQKPPQLSYVAAIIFVERPQKYLEGKACRLNASNPARSVTVLHITKDLEEI